MTSFAELGNDLYTGRRSFDFVGRLRRWLAVAAVLLVIVIIGFAARGLNLGMEFTGGSDFRVADVADTDNYTERAQGVLARVSGVPNANVTIVGGDGIRVRTERIDDRLTRQVSAGLAQEFGTGTDQVTSSVVGPSWGQSVTRQAVRALVIFLGLVAVLLAVYFRTWKMAFAALAALAHDVFLTVGIYSIAGFEVTPASAIGFLTILGYSLYDTVVVFDKVRENTTEALATGRSSYSTAANLAVNQTLVRSINTSVVALLPVLAILVVGLTVIGPGTVLDLSLALAIGIVVGTFSSVFIATPLLAWLREREPVMKHLTERAERYAAAEAAPTGGEAISDPDAALSPECVRAAMGGPSAGASAADAPTRTITGRPIHPSMLDQDEQPPPRRRGRRRSKTTE